VDDLLTERLAELAVGFGANVQADQIVMVTAELGRESLARAVAAAAYRAGARYVDVTYSDAFVRRAKIENAGDDAIGYAPPWHVERMKQMGEQRVAVISLEAAIDPAATDGLDPIRLGADQSPVRQAYLRLVMERLINWCIIACPTPEWAARVHPDLPVDQAFELLSQEIARVCRTTRWPPGRPASTG
jgi:aminopeptidase